MISRGEIAGKILRLLQKTAQYQGFYDNEKINDAIEDCMDYIAVEMFLANEGWQTKIQYFATEPNLIQLPLPPHIGMITDVRVNFAQEYLPLVYCDMNGRSQLAPDSGVQQYASSYRIIDNALFFNPPLAEGGDNFLMVEYMTWPKRLVDNADFVEAHFFKPFVHYVKYRAASILVSGVGKADPDWIRYEEQWFKQMQEVVVKRNLQRQYITDFDGC